MVAFAAVRRKGAGTLQFFGRAADQSKRDTTARRIPARSALVMEDDAPPPVPEWVVTYGDMMSLLLTFFIMLVSLSEVVADQKYRAILDALQQYLGYRTAPAAPEGQSFPLNSLLESLTALGSFTDRELGRGGVRTQGVEGTDYRVLRTREGISRVVGTVPFDPGGTALTEAARVSLG
jgi:hypothetical protein